MTVGIHWGILEYHSRISMNILEALVLPEVWDLSVKHSGFDMDDTTADYHQLRYQVIQV